MKNYIGQKIKIFLICLTLNIIGILFIFSSCYKTNPVFFYKQIIWSIIGIIFFILFAFYDYKNLKKLKWSYFLLSIILILSVLIFGEHIRGTRGWLNFHYFKIQPVELVKILFCLFIASYYAGFKPRQINNIVDNFFIPVGCILFISLSILIQPDTGSALIFVLICFFTLTRTYADKIILWSSIALGILFVLSALIFFKYKNYVLSLNHLELFINQLIIFSIICLLIKYFNRKAKLLGIILAFIMIILYQISIVEILKHMPGHIEKRMEVYFNPAADPTGSGYNILQAQIAIGSAGVLGKGYLNGSQNQLGFIPEKTTDFIFSIIVEETGILGAVIILLLYFLLLKKICFLFKKRDNIFAKIILTYSFFYFAFHIIINISVNLNLLPTVGLPLPFISYGGSFLINCYILAGIVCSKE